MYMVKNLNKTQRAWMVQYSIELVWLLPAYIDFRNKNDECEISGITNYYVCNAVRCEENAVLLLIDLHRVVVLICHWLLYINYYTHACYTNNFCG